MSYIDTIDNEYVAHLAGYPVYHPLDTIADRPYRDADFGCSPSNLVLGGGCGEHPGLVIHRLDALALHFVDASLDGLKMKDTCNESWDWFPINDYLFLGWENHFEFSGWSVAQFQNFYEACLSPTLFWPFDPQEIESFEKWLAISLGELVWFSLADLIPSLSSVRDRHPRLRVLAQNIMTIPSGYPKTAGRRTINNHDIQWGNYRWQTDDTSDSRDLGG